MAKEVESIKKVRLNSSKVLQALTKRQSTAATLVARDERAVMVHCRLSTYEIDNNKRQ